MPAATEITQVLRAAEDWPVWISQVNARLLVIDCREYLSINSSGGLDLTAPTPPAKRARVPGESGLLEWPQDGEYLQYVKSKNEYLGFMLAVQRSISPEMGFNVSEERSFGELLAGLRAHLGLDGGSRALVSQVKAEGSWVSLLRQDLRSKSVQDWGERLVGMYRSVREYGIDGLRNWRPHVDFVVSVNRFYPTMSGTIYLYLDRMQEEEGEPRADSFERLVRLGAGIVARLAETRGGSSVAGAPVRAFLEAPGGENREDAVMGEALSEPKLIEIRGDSQSLSTRKRKRDGSKSDERERVEELQSDMASKSSKKAKKAHKESAASSEETASSGNTTPAKKTTSAETAITPAENTTSAKKSKRGAEPEAEKATREKKAREKKAREKEKEQEKERKRQKKEQEKKSKKVATPKPAPKPGCGICENSKHFTKNCGLLNLYRMYGDATRGMTDLVKGICRVLVHNEVAERQRAEEVSDESETSGDEGSVLNESSEEEGPATNDSSEDEDFSQSGPSDEEKDEGPISTEDSGCYICMEEGHFAEACQLLADYRLGKGAGRKQLHCDVRKRCKGWLRFQEESREDGKDHQEPMCHVCRRTGHRGVACRLIALYQKHRAAPGKLTTTTPRIANGIPNGPNSFPAQLPAKPPVSSSRVKSARRAANGNPCIPNTTQSRLPTKQPAPSPQVITPTAPGLYDRCYICESPTHGTDACGSLGVYKKRGGKALGSLPKAYVELCMVWLAGSPNPPEALNAPNDSNPHNAPNSPKAPGCQVCKSKGHSVDGCSALGLYRARGECATINEDTRSRCRAVLRKEQANEMPVGPSVMCVICQAKGHIGKTCLRLEAWRRHDGDVWGMPDDVGDRCREWVEEERAEIRGRLVERRVPRPF